jgi:hypothetical protein
LAAQVPSNQVLNYCGIVISLSSIFFYVFVKTSPGYIERITLLEKFRLETIDKQSAVAEDQTNEREDFFNRFSPRTRRIIGYALAGVVGLMYGSAFVPMIYMGQEENKTNYLDYLLAYYSGIFVTSLSILIIYTILTKNKPVVYPSRFGFRRHVGSG